MPIPSVKTLDRTRPPKVRVRCVSDRYDADGATRYDSVNAFLAMAHACFDSMPTLVQRSDGWYEGDVLILVAT